MKNSMRSFLLLALCAAFAPVTNAETLFSDDFDGEPYSDNLPLVTGPHQIQFGQWNLNNKGEGTAIVSTNAALSPKRSLALTVKNQGDLAQAIASPGADGHRTPTSQGIVAKAAFYLSDLNSLNVFVVRDSSENNLAIVKVGVGGVVKVIFGDRTETLGAITSATWYYLALSMPPSPGASGAKQYEVTLYEADGTTEIGFVAGTLCSQAPSGEYAYLSVYQEGSANLSEPVTSYFDNFSIEATP